MQTHFVGFVMSRLILCSWFSSRNRILFLLLLVSPQIYFINKRLTTNKSLLADWVYVVADYEGLDTLISSVCMLLLAMWI